MNSEHQEAKPTRGQWVRLHAAVQPAADPHPVQGWELGEYIALLKNLWEEIQPNMKDYTGIIVYQEMNKTYPLIHKHIEEGCSYCLEDILLLFEILGPPKGTSLSL